ncbi:MAG: recombination protein O N-terminal domain-containing protein [Lentisphaeria bacterium]|nr:recombination protein O N-terminal domain-containing protein [Lentisphaeria bacterium]
MSASEPCRTSYILLRKTPFQESSLIVSGLSPDFGRIDFLLKGAKLVSKKKFPEAELFREFQVIFREARNAEGLANLISAEPVAAHDGIASNPDHYIAACNFAAFLLRNTKPMLPVPLSFRAFQLLLNRLEKSRTAEPWLSLARYAFLYENGLVPQGEDVRQERLLAIATEPEIQIPDDRNDFWKRFVVWVDNLCDWNQLRK